MRITNKNSALAIVFLFLLFHTVTYFPQELSQGCLDFSVPKAVDNGVQRGRSTAYSMRAARPGETGTQALVSNRQWLLSGERWTQP